VQWSFQWGLVVTGKGWWLRSDGGGGATDGNVREVCACAWGDHCCLLVFVNVEGKRDISWVKNHVQVTCVRLRLRLTMEMDGGGEIERN
jgi:hypothetical protein